MRCFSSLVQKFIIFAFNVVIAAGGATLIAYGIRYTVAEQNGISIFGDLLFGVVAIVAGGVSLLVILLGCIGAWFENSKLLPIYGGVLMGLFIVKLSLGIMAVSKIQNPVNLASEIHRIMEYLFIDDRTSFDKLQQEFQCCGITGLIDYNGTFPASCCAAQANPCLDPFPDGCAWAFKSVIDQYVKTIGYVALIFAVIDLMAAFFALIPRKQLQSVSHKEDAWY